MFSQTQAIDIILTNIRAEYFESQPFQNQKISQGDFLFLRIYLNFQISHYSNQ